MVASPKLLLQLCVSTLHFIFCVLSKVCNWTAGSSKAAKSAVSSLERKVSQGTVRDAATPTSVNYHFTRKCNYKCGFCFHTAKTSFVLPLEEAERGLKLLKESGTVISLYTAYSVPVCGVNPFTRCSFRVSAYQAWKRSTSLEESLSCTIKETFWGSWFSTVKWTCSCQVSA